MSQFERIFTQVRSLHQNSTFTFAIAAHRPKAPQRPVQRALEYLQDYWQVHEIVREKGFTVSILLWKK